jgi:endonuclease/exonuclease/phosphatase family metal-dependent hydrolase
MSYNIAAGNNNLNAITDVIRAASPDLVALQEVDAHWSARSNFEDQAVRLGEALNMQVRFAQIYRNPPETPGAPLREYGVALLSRYPIVAFNNRMLSRVSTQTPSTTPERMPGLLDAIVDVDGVNVRVLNTHLDYRSEPAVRSLQVTEMLELLRSSTGPTLLLGDLNAPPDAPELAPLLNVLRDSWRDEFGSGFTYPATEPLRRIDYVLASPHFRAHTAIVPAVLASDHRPVVVELRLSRYYNTDRLAERRRRSEPEVISACLYSSRLCTDIPWSRDGGIQAL